MTEPVPCFNAHGLHISGLLPLSAPTSVGPPDLSVTLGSYREIPWQRPAPEVIAELIGPEGWARYSFCAREGGGVTARVYSLADFELNADRSEVVAHPATDVDKEIVAILLAGTVAAFVLMERGACVLHASAVELSPGHAIAFAGFSARGKTTSAALLCASGRALVTDDVLVVDMDDGVPRCGPGGTELRLRPQQIHLADAFGDRAIRRATADDRIAVRPSVEPCPAPELAAVVVPNPTRRSTRVRVERLDVATATSELIAAPRIEGWRRPEDIRRVFDQSVDLAARVPVLRAEIPWGPPFPPRIADALSTAIEAELAGATAGSRR